MFSSTALFRAYRSILFPWKQNLLAHLVFRGRRLAFLQRAVEFYIWQKKLTEFSSVFSPVFQYNTDVDLYFAFVAQSVERSLGKTEVSGSIPDEGSVWRLIRQQNDAKVLKWSTRAVCKTAGPASEGSNPSLGTVKRGNAGKNAPLAQLVRAPVL